MADKKTNPGNGLNPKKLKGSNRLALFLLLLLTVLISVSLITRNQKINKVINYSTFKQHLADNNVKDVEIVNEKEIYFALKSDTAEKNTRYTTVLPFQFDPSLQQLMDDKNIDYKGKIQTTPPYMVFFQLVLWILFFVFLWYMFRNAQGGGGGNKAFSFGKSKAKMYKDDAAKTKFADVAGQREAKYELEEVVDFLKNPKKYADIGAKIPKGVLLVGMPGTGKTLLAKAVAGEAGVPFFHMSGSDFVEMFVGVGASRVRDLFEQGRKNAPCIIFIDELDAVGRTRGAGYGGGHDEREQTLNQMLVEMDGFDTNASVIILAATNRPDVLDPALLRPGRFDRQVVVDMPDVAEREAILKIHAKKIQLAEDVDLNRVAKATPGSSGADIANLVNEAALFAARGNRTTVSMNDFEEARDKTLLGVARTSRMITDEEKYATACHEAGHALLHYYLKNADPLHKVSVVPRGRTLGVAISLPEKDSYSRNYDWLVDRIKITMGGYIAEKLIYNQTTTGTQNDIRQATDFARRMVCEWGMSGLGFISFGSEDEPIFIGKEIAQHKDYSEDTARRVDQEMSLIIHQCMESATNILTEHLDQLKMLADALVKNETMDDCQIRVLLNLPAIEKLTTITSEIKILSDESVTKESVEVSQIEADSNPQV